MRPANPIPAPPGAMAYSSNANTGWADEFLHAHNQPGSDPRAMAAQLHEGNRFNPSAQSNLGRGQMNPNPATLAWPTPDERVATNAVQREIDLHMATRQNHTPIHRYTEPHTMYPTSRINDDARLADSAEQAMEAAFAAYDQDFEGAMDGWLRADAANGLENHVQNIRMMEEMKLEDPMAGQTGLTTNGPSTKPEVPVSNKFAHDSAMMRHAEDIVTTLSNNGSDEVKVKMSSSSFQGLMRAIASGKAAVVDDNFIDTSSGEVINDWGELSGVKPSDTGNSLQDAADSTSSKDKGKGKMKSLEEQEQEHSKSA